MGVLLVVMFIVFVAIGVPISFALGVVSFTGIASLGQIPNLVVFQKMFNGLNSFTLLAVPLFILAANLMNEGEITEKLIDCCNSLVGHLRGGLAYSNVDVYKRQSWNYTGYLWERRSICKRCDRGICRICQ